MIIYSAGVIGFEVDPFILQGLCTNLPLFTKVVFACFDRGSHVYHFLSAAEPAH